MATRVYVYSEKGRRIKTFDRQSIYTAAQAMAATDGVDARALRALIDRARAPVVLGSADGAEHVAHALWGMSSSAAGRAACLAAGAPGALVALARAPSVLGSADAARWVACALSRIALGVAGKAACLAAGAPGAILALWFTFPELDLAPFRKAYSRAEIEASIDAAASARRAHAMIAWQLWHY
jgi:hypothetical protein